MAMPARERERAQVGRPIDHRPAHEPVPHLHLLVAVPLQVEGPALVEIEAPASMECELSGSAICPASLSKVEEELGN